jgi:hypothetical protein
MTKKKETCAQGKMHKVMSEFKEGKLKIGKSNKTVISRQQAVAIGLSETRVECGPRSVKPRQMGRTGRSRTKY